MWGVGGIWKAACQGRPCIHQRNCYWDHFWGSWRNLGKSQLLCIPHLQRAPKLTTAVVYLRKYLSFFPPFSSTWTLISHKQQLGSVWEEIQRSRDGPFPLSPYWFSTLKKLQSIGGGKTLYWKDRQVSFYIGGGLFNYWLTQKWQEKLWELPGIPFREVTRKNVVSFCLHLPSQLYFHWLFCAWSVPHEITWRVLDCFCSHV